MSIGAVSVVVSKLKLYARRLVGWTTYHGLLSCFRRCAICGTLVGFTDRHVVTVSNDIADTKVMHYACWDAEDDNDEGY
jgi:hypothetical protein